MGVVMRILSLVSALGFGFWFVWFRLRVSASGVFGFGSGFRLLVSASGVDASGADAGGYERSRERGEGVCLRLKRPRGGR